MGASVLQAAWSSLAHQRRDRVTGQSLRSLATGSATSVAPVMEGASEHSRSTAAAVSSGVQGGPWQP